MIYALGPNGQVMRGGRGGGKGGKGAYGGKGMDGKTTAIYKRGGAQKHSWTQRRAIADFQPQQADLEVPTAYNYQKTLYNIGTKFLFSQRNCRNSTPNAPFLNSDR